MPHRFDELLKRLPAEPETISYGDHACLLYADPAEQMDAVAPFVREGLLSGDLCVYIADDQTVLQVAEALRSAGVEVDAEQARGALRLRTKRDAYLRDGFFEPEGMVAFLENLVDEAKAAGYRGVRVTGEMTWALGKEPGCDRLLEYECLLADLFPRLPLMAICQYSLTRFEPAFIREVLRTHPKVMLGKHVCANFYYEMPSHVLSPRDDAARVTWMLSQLKRQAVEAAARRRVQQELDEHVRVLEFLNDVPRRFGGELDLDPLVQTVTDLGREVTGAEFGAFFYNTVDARGERYMLYTLSGARREDFENFPLPRNTCVFEPTFRGEGIVRSADITLDERYGKMPPHFGLPKGHLPVRSYLAAPVVGRAGDVIGGLFYGHPEPGIFTERAEALLEGIAAQAAIAFDNARLFESVKTNERRYRNIFDSIGVSIWEEDFSEVRQEIEKLRAAGVGDVRAHLRAHPGLIGEIAGKIRVGAVNRHSLQMFGAESLEQLRAGFKQMERPETREAFLEEFAAIAEGRRHLSLETRAGRLDGADLDVILSIAFPEDESDWKSVPVSFVDVTAQKWTEEALRRTEHLYRAIGESINYGVWVCDMEGQNVYASSSLLNLLGITQEQCAEFGWGNYLHPAQRDEVMADWRETVRSGDFWERELQFLGVDGQWHHCLARGLPIVENGEVVYWAGINLDIGTLKATERALRESEQRLRELNESLERRVQERTDELQKQTRQLQMLANALTEAEQQERRKLAQILHDGLQQTLVAIKMQLQMSRGRGPALEKIEALVAETIDTARSLARELSPPVLHDSSLAKALEWLSRWFLEIHHFHVTVEAGEDFPPLRENAKVFLFNAVRELLLNAVKHAGVDKAHVRLDLADGAIQVEVSDHGQGFEASTLEDSADIHGFGLFSIRQRIEALGGSFIVESRPAAGARFLMTLHEAAELSPAVGLNGRANGNGAAARLRERSLGPTRILVTDDHRIVREGFVAMLQTDDTFEIVGEAANGLEAIEFARRLRPDIIVMDINMPVIDGIEATRRIKVLYPEIHIIGLSLHEEQDKADAMREAGASAYLRKDGPSEMLFETIRGLSGTPSRSTALPG